MDGGGRGGRGPLGHVSCGPPLTGFSRYDCLRAVRTLQCPAIKSYPQMVQLFCDCSVKPGCWPAIVAPVAPGALCCGAGLQQASFQAVGWPLPGGDLSSSSSVSSVRGRLRAW